MDWVGKDHFTLALSGGSTVAAIHALLAQRQDVDWTRVFCFWGDERFVDLKNPYSNYGLAEQTLFRLVPALPNENVFPVPVDAPTPVEGARRYAEILRNFFGAAAGAWPCFDLCLNGMGPDGHTASLFPGSPSLKEASDLAIMNHAGLSPWVDRVTLTLPLFNHARCVLFTAHGAGKAETLRSVLEGPKDADRLPSQAIDPVDGKAIWLIEPQIARLLSR